MLATGQGNGAEPGPGPGLGSWIIRQQPTLGWALAGLCRHKWTAGGVWLAITAAAMGWVFSLPSIYQAEAVVLVESSRIAEQLVLASVDTDLEARLDLARQKLQGTVELQAVMRALNPYAEQRRAGASEESLAAQMRRSLTIATVDPTGRSRLGPCRVAFSGPDPQMAARVANHVAQRFIEEVSQGRRSGSGAAAQFLSTRVVSARRELDQREDALREFWLQHSEELPEQAEPLRATARQLRAELARLRDEALLLEQEKSALGQAAVKATAAGANSDTSGSSGEVANASAPPRPSDADELKKRLKSLLAVYTPEYPDVRRLMAEVARAESLEAEASASGGSSRDGVKPETSPEPDGTNGARARLGQIEERLETLAARRTQLAAELGATEESLQRVPLWQQELATLTRDHAFFGDQLRSLIARQRSAEMAEALERSYPSERVSMLEKARPPAKPLGPRRWSMLGMASLGGLLVGWLVALARMVQADGWGQAEPVVAPTRPECGPDAPAHAGWGLPAEDAAITGCTVAGSG